MKVALIATADEALFKSRRTKYLHEIIDRPLIAYTIENARAFSQDIFVVAHPNQDLQTTVEALGAKFLEEHHAASFFAQFNELPLLVLQGDDFGLIKHLYPNYFSMPSLADTIHRLIRLHLSSGAPATYLQQDDPYGSAAFSVTLSGASVQVPADHPYIVAAKHFAPLSQVIENLPAAEAYPISLATSNRIITRADLSSAISLVSSSNCTKLSNSGVTVHHGAIIGSNVSAGQDAVIYSGTEITGSTHIGAGTTIAYGTRLHNMTIGANCNIERSVLLDSTVGDHTRIGPFAYVRPSSNIGSYCRIGDFVEVKNSTLGDNTNASHLAYIGDAIVGSRVNFGCGSITVNYDGNVKHLTTIEDGAFVGSNCNLVAPVTIGKDSFVAAGTTVTKDVEPRALAIARVKQESKPGWVSVRH